MEKTVGFRNQNQVTIFERELKQQLVDGHWVKSKPHGHHEPWVEATIYVAENEKQLGRNFEPRRINYNLPAKELVDVAGEKMVNLVNFTNQFGDQPAGTYPANQEDYDTMSEDRKAVLTDLGITDKKAKEVFESKDYTLKDLRKDLWDMKSIQKVEATEARSESTTETEVTETEAIEKVS